MPISNPSNQFGNSQFVVDPTLGRGSFQTIAAALAASASGDTIYIRPGTYAESLTANMAGKSIVAAASGSNNFEVVIQGNHVFDTVGSVSFQNIRFEAAAGVGFALGAAGAGTYEADFEDCEIVASAGAALTGSSAGGTVDIRLFQTVINGSTQGCNLANGSCFFDNCSVTGGSANAIECGASSTLNAFNCDLTAASSDAVLISDAAASYTGKECLYTCADAAISFSANGSARSLTEQFDSSNASGFYVDATAAVGQYSYANSVILGSASSIDPQVTATSLPVQGGGEGTVVWLDDPAAGALQVNSGYVLKTLVKSFSLPAASAFGDVIEIVLAGGTSWTVTQAAGQQIFIGNTSTTLGAGGSLASNAQGDSLKMVCSAANTTWYVLSTVGNLTVV